jgi:Flp pilus assembly protein TadD
LIVLAGICTYWNSLHVPFVWDDDTAIVNNRTIRELWPLWHSLVPPAETPVARRPVVNLSLAVNYALGGLDVTGYHVWNLGVHLLAALVLFGIIRRTLAGGRLGDRWTAAAADVALIATLGWMLHPMVSEVIDYTTQRTSSMMGLFFLLTLYCAIRGLDSRRRTRWHVLAVVACVCGMATKESMAAAPLIVVLYDRIFVFSSVRDALRVRQHLYVAFLATWGLLGVLIWLRPHSTVGFSGGIDAWTYLLNQARLIPHYLRLALWPDALVLDYGPPEALSVREVVGPGLLVVALLVGAGVALVRWPAIGFLCAAFFVILAPDSSIVPIVTEAGAERRMYLPLAALVVLVVTVGWWLFARARSAWAASHGRLITVVALAITTVWLASLAVLTVYRNAEYATPVSIWRSSVERHPHGRARLSYADALVAAGDSDPALAQLREAVKDYPPARYALGTELAARGEMEQAIRELTMFIDQDPSHLNRIPARSLLGRALWTRGRFEESADQFRSILTRAPSSIDAHASLGDVLLQQKKYTEAVSHYRTVVGLRPDQADWQIKLGIALASSGKLDEAVDAYQKALQLDPASRVAHISLADLFLRRNRGSDAALHAREALRLEPGDAVAHNLLGAGLASQGKLAEAVEHFRTALTLAPDHADARRNLEQATRLLGVR